MANHSPVKDSGGFLVINPATRQVTVPTDQKALGAVGDHLSEQKTFMCPQIIDGHDVSACARKYVTWKNVDGELGHDELGVVKNDDGTIKVEDGKFYLTWTIRKETTVAKGIVQFSVHFEDADGAVVYRWGTQTNQNCEILDSVNARLGAYAAIYVNGETLIFADYTPVHDGKLDLASCVLPTDTLEIHTEGEHDVGKYAYAKVAGLYENPSISLLGGGVVSATANGREGRYQLDPPVITVEGGKVTAEASGAKSVKQLEHPDISVKDGEITASASGLASSHFLTAADFGLATLTVHVVNAKCQIYYPKMNADGDVDYDTRILDCDGQVLSVKAHVLNNVIKGMPIYIRVVTDVPNADNCRVEYSEDWMMYPNMYVPAPQGVDVLDTGRPNNGRDHHGTVAFKVTDDSAHISVSWYDYTK